MINCEKDLIDFIVETYRNAKIEKNRFAHIVVKLDRCKTQCEFYFNRFSEGDKYCAERFVGHNCLGMGFVCGNTGGGYMEVCDKADLRHEISAFIELHLKGLKRKAYEQLTLF